MSGSIVTDLAAELNEQRESIDAVVGSVEALLELVATLRRDVLKQSAAHAGLAEAHAAVAEWVASLAEELSGDELSRIRLSIARLHERIDAISEV